MLKPILYMQTDPKYGKHNYSARGEHKTISSSGCGVTCAAMIIQTLRPDKKVTPITTAEWSMKHGYKALNQGTYYTYFEPQFKAYGLRCKQLNNASVYHKLKASVHDVAKKKLISGCMLIACMGVGNWTRAGHFIVVYGYKDGYVYINDPASTAGNRVKAKWSTFANEVKYYFAVTVGTKTETKLKGNLYKHPDIKRGKYCAIMKGTFIKHVFDLKDGWSIAIYGNTVGYAKNSVFNKKLSDYKKSTVIKKTHMRKNNSKTSGKIMTVPSNTTVKIITKRKYWTNVIVAGKRGYIPTSKLK